MSDKSSLIIHVNGHGSVFLSILRFVISVIKKLLTVYTHFIVLCLAPDYAAIFVLHLIHVIYPEGETSIVINVVQCA